MTDYFSSKGISNKDVVHLHFVDIDSTNSWVKRNIANLNVEKITLITAEKQSAGRGRFQRKWESPDCQNLYASFCLFVPNTVNSLGNIGQIMAISIAQVLFKLDFKPTMKWPNDILLAGKKVGGILCETISHDNQICIIVGVGLNVNMPLELVEKIDQKATSLYLEKDTSISLEEVTLLLRKQFTHNLTVFLKEGFDPFVDILRLLTLQNVNKKITFRGHDGVWEGVFHSIDQDGSLLMQLPIGEIKKISSGEIIYNEELETLKKT